MTEKQSKLGVAVVGCGTVGGAAATLLTRDRDTLVSRAGRDIQLLHIVDVDFTNARRLELDDSLFRDNLETALTDDDVSVVVELVGGLTFAKEVTERALRAGKCVVTANKALLAHHGPELFALARENGVSISFEASCAGGIPIIRALCSLVANRIDALYGIVNGTCNFILSSMAETGQSYAEALADAQAGGLAEADPTLDVGGGDSAHKLAIMASLAFGQKVDVEAIPTVGIDTLELCDIQWGFELGYVVKLLAIAQRRSKGISLRVRPVFISQEHPLAWVSGPFNAVSVYGHATGHTMYYGRGAGGMPTASAVVGDIAAIAVGTAQADFKMLGLWADKNEPAVQLPISDVKSRYYIRMMVQDHPGVLANVAAILSRYNISICSVLQHEYDHEVDHEADDSRPLVITTYRSNEGDLRQALEEIDALDDIRAKSICIGIVDEHPEELLE
ncbi:MAG: homoserine dehydrogenase [Phycisphaerae bacterium]|nr:homoserine dehydrogenase [Phycisphaerae bacterium]